MILLVFELIPTDGIEEHEWQWC